MERIYTIDGITGKPIDIQDAIKCLLYVVNDCCVFGYTMTAVVPTRIFTDKGWNSISIPIGKFGDHLFYNNSTGQYDLDFNVPLNEFIRAKYVKTSGFPYSFLKKYEAIDNFIIFKDKQYVVNSYHFPISNYFKYTFGLEFETSVGIIPEEICFRDGLIPLRDGSITGNEYSTVVLKGEPGFNLLYQQLKTLRQYTRFDKECSLHMHIGGFPLEPNKILSLYNLCYLVQNELQTILPAYTFRTASYKASGKDYCKLLPHSFTTFTALYKTLTHLPFYGNLEQPHPDDVGRERKWQIHERYYWANILNLICYKVNKTMEFRMLRPTYNLEKILFWMYVFNALLIYAENHDCVGSEHITIESILHEMYPEDLVKTIMIGYYKNQICVSEQTKCGDYIGGRTDIEDEFFNKDLII